MKLHTRTILFISVILVTVTVLTCGVSIYSVSKKSNREIQTYEQVELEKARKRLRNIVDIGYDILKINYENDTLALGVQMLSEVSFDDFEGYYWITDTQSPPVMIMHAAEPSLNGQVMRPLAGEDSLSAQNAYQKRAIKTLEDGFAFMEYSMPKPGTDTVYQKLSYSRLFEPTQWVISAGLYTDSISRSLQQKKDELSSQLSALIIRILLIGIIILLIAVLITWKYIQTKLSSISEVGDRLSLLSQGRKVSQIQHAIGTDEIGEMRMSLNLLIERSDNYSSFAREISKGNLDASIENSSNEDTLATDLMVMRDNLIQIVTDTNYALYNAGEEGLLSERIDLGGKEGVWYEMADLMNNLLISLSGPIMEVRRVMHEVAKGNLSVSYDLHSKGDLEELSSTINLSLSQLTDLLGKIASLTATVDESATDMMVSSEEMSRSTSEISSAIDEMSSGAQAQVSKVDEVSTLIERILNSSNDMEEKAKLINDAAKNGSEKSANGRSMLDELIKSIQSIMKQASKTQDSIDVLKGRSNEISQVLTVISDIASQTNLLALNAAIEAAQAGDAGRGFAVVAEEIRKLAEDSRKSAVKIEHLVEEVQKDTVEAANAMILMNDEVNTGTKVSNEASDIFKEMTSSSEHTYHLSEEIVEATNAQVKNIQEVVGITEGVVVIAEETAAGTEEVASSAAELASGMDNYKVKSGELNSIAASLANELSNFTIKKSSKEYDEPDEGLPKE